MKIIVEVDINHVSLKVVVLIMEEDETDTKPSVTKEEDPKVKKDTQPVEKEEPEYVGLPDRDLRKNLGCG